MSQGIRVNRPTLYRLAAESARDPATVQAVLSGKGNAQSRAAVLAAARRLDLVEVSRVLADDPAPTKIRAT